MNSVTSSVLTNLRLSERTKKIQKKNMYYMSITHYHTKPSLRWTGWVL